MANLDDTWYAEGAKTARAVCHRDGRWRMIHVRVGNEEIDDHIKFTVGSYTFHIPNEDKDWVDAFKAKYIEVFQNQKRTELLKEVAPPTTRGSPFAECSWAYRRPPRDRSIPSRTVSYTRRASPLSKTNPVTKKTQAFTTMISISSRLKPKRPIAVLPSRFLLPRSASKPTTSSDKSPPNAARS